ncbi:MAG TPA: hypothetical protein VK066_04600 [Chloroflexota bacterium]|nr:hypothetical protein [Chloroflexota bacterium]
MTLRPMVAYYGVGDPRHCAQDFQEMARAFRTVVFPCSEELARLDAAGLRERVRLARDLGLETWVSPWGVAGLFGGEAISAVGHLCPRSCQVRDVLAAWLEAAVAAAPDVLFWDEPNGTRCCGPEVVTALLLDLMDQTPAALRHALYWNPEQCAILPEPVVARCLTAGMDLYGRSPAAERLATALALGQCHGVEPHVWVRAFQVPAGEEAAVAAMIQAAAAAGIERVGIWPWKAGATASLLASERPALVWETVLRALATSAAS